MKKLFALLLTLLLVFGLSVPAMAFTSDSSEDVDHPYDLSIYLVEYDDNDLFGLVALPESDRGYAKNEIVAAVVELFVPKDEIIINDEYANLVFGGDNVDLDVTDNYNAAHTAISLQTSQSVKGLVAADYALGTALVSDEISITVGSVGDQNHGLSGKETYKWLFFAKVTDDDASLYAKLIDGNGSVGFTTDGVPQEYDEMLTVTLDGVLYTIYFVDLGNDSLAYEIVWDDGGTNAIAIYTDEDYKSTGMQIDYAGDAVGYYSLGVNTAGELGILDRTNPAKILTSGDEYDDIMDIYEDVVVDVFGLDYFNIGNYVRKSFFEDLVSADTIIATVDIEPWTAYVTVPDNIVVDPPKTGDAASVMSFVMVALSGIGAVALKKRS